MPLWYFNPSTLRTKNILCLNSTNVIEINVKKCNYKNTFLDKKTTQNVFLGGRNNILDSHRNSGIEILGPKITICDARPIWHLPYLSHLLHLPHCENFSQIGKEMVELEFYHTYHKLPQIYHKLPHLPKIWNHIQKAESETNLKMWSNCGLKSYVKFVMDGRNSTHIHRTSPNIWV